MDIHQVLVKPKVTELIEVYNGCDYGATANNQQTINPKAIQT